MRGWLLMGCMLLSCGTPAQPLNTGNTPKPALRVGAAGGFGSSLARLVPQLSRDLGQPIQLVYTSNSGVFKLMNNPNPPYDLGIGSLTPALEQALDDQYIAVDRLQKITRFQVALWCPNLPLRIRPEDTLAQPAVRILAMGQKNGPIMEAVQKSVLIPEHLKLAWHDHALGSWQMVRQGRAQCGFVMNGLLAPHQPRQLIKNSHINVVSAVSRHAAQPEVAYQLVDLLRSPRWQARLQAMGYERGIE